MHKLSENGEYSSLPTCTLAQNEYVQQCDSTFVNTTIGVSQRDVHWKTVNIKPEVPNITQTWKNQVGFMMQPYDFFKDIDTLIKFPIIPTALKRYVDPTDTSGFTRVMEEAKFYSTTDKGQSCWASKKGSAGKSVFAQMNDEEVLCAQVYAICFDRHWEDMQLQHYKEQSVR